MQRKSFLGKERNRVSAVGAIQRLITSDRAICPSGTCVDISECLSENGFISTPRNEHSPLSNYCEQKIRDHDKENHKKLELCRGNERRNASHPSQTSRNARQRTPSPSLMNETEPDQPMAENNASSLVLNVA